MYINKRRIRKQYSYTAEQIYFCLSLFNHKMAVIFTTKSQRTVKRLNVINSIVTNSDSLQGIYNNSKSIYISKIYSSCFLVIRITLFAGLISQSHRAESITCVLVKIIFFIRKSFLAYLQPLFFLQGCIINKSLLPVGLHKAIQKHIILQNLSGAKLKHTNKNTIKIKGGLNIHIGQNLLSLARFFP